MANLLLRSLEKYKLARFPLAFSRLGQKRKMSEEQGYLDVTRDVIENGYTESDDRTGVGTKHVVGRQFRFSLANRTLPLLTTKKLYHKGIVEELLWFVRGSTDSKDLEAKGVNIWKGNTSREFLDGRGLSEYDEGTLGPCFPAGTLVQTRIGYMPIEDVPVDAQVFTHEGNYKAVDARMENPYSGRMYTIRSHLSDVPVDCTAEHPFLHQDLHGNIGFVQAKDLVVGEYVGMKVESKQIKPILFLNNPTTGILERSTVDSDDIWWLLGYFCRNGRFVGQGPQMHMHIPEKVNAEFLARLNELVGIRRLEGTGSIFEIVDRTSYTAQLIDHLSDSAMMTVPSWIHRADVAYIEMFLEGYLAVAEASSEVIAETLDVALALQKLFAKIGFYTTVVRRPDNFVLVQCSEPVLVDSEYVWFPITDIQNRVVQDVPVYNLTIKDDSTYTVNNTVVHNCYGFNWRHFGAKYQTPKTDYSGQGVDQLQNAINELKKNPASRRIIITALDPSTVHRCVLPPCHFAFQFITSGNKLSILVNQRSADIGLGIPFNIASYALLCFMVGHVTGLEPHEVVISTGHTHVYLNHIDGLTEQLKRKPYPLPKLAAFRDDIKDIDGFVADDFIVENYVAHPRIVLPFAI